MRIKAIAEMTYRGYTIRIRRYNVEITGEEFQYQNYAWNVEAAKKLINKRLENGKGNN
jgi:hypothetical protein